jgi:hypothetical protein
MHEEEHKEECGCGCDHDDDCEDIEDTPEDVAHNANDKVDALINLLIKKKVITEDEFETEYDELFEESEDDSEE